MKNKEIEIRVNGEKITGIIENIDAPKLIILTHGFTGNMNGPDDLFKKLSIELQKQDYSVLRFNFRGTSPSEGNFQDMTLASETQDLDAIIKYALSLGYTQLALLGESMGGTIALNTHSSKIKALILWYTAFNFGDTNFRTFFTEEKQKEMQEKGFLTCAGFKVGKEFIDQIPKIDLYKNLENITCPTLLLHGDHDSDVPVQQSQKAYDDLKSIKEIHILKGAGHCFRNEQKEAILFTCDFIKKYF